MHCNASMTHCCFSCTSMKSNKYLEISYATSKYQVLHCCRMQPNDNMICFASTFVHWGIGVICIWSKYNTERQSHLLSRHFSPAPSFHSPFLSISSTIFLFTPLSFNFMFFIALFFSIHIFTYAADRDASQGLQLSPSTLSFHFLPFLSF